jgi:hypothetical protein
VAPRGGGGHLEAVPLTSGRTELLLNLDAPAEPALTATAQRALRGLRDHLEQRPEDAAARRRTHPGARRRRALALTAMLGVPTLALVVAVLGSSPTPVSVDDRVADFRAHAGAHDGEATRPPRPSDEGPDAATTTGQDEGHGQREATGQPAAAPPPQPASGSGPADDGTETTEPRDRAAPDAARASSAEEVEADGDREERAGPRRPQPGVYRYATTGGDRLSMRGSARDYPETTSVTIRHDDCGFTQRWDVFDERWEERTWCVEDGPRQMMAMSSYREFFGHGVRTDLRCDGSAPSPEAVEPGAGWMVVCENGDTRATTSIEVGDEARIEVDGERVDTLHLSLEATVEGETEGRMSGEQWIAPETGLLVRERWETEVETSGPMGPITYREDYTLLLESTEPAR